MVEFLWEMWVNILDMDPMGMDNYEASIMCIIDGASLCHFVLSQPVETCANQIESTQ